MSEMDPYLVEESTTVKLAPRLKNIASKLNDDATHHDYLIALFIALLNESGFLIFSENSDAKCLESNVPFEYQVDKWKLTKNGTYDLNLYYHSVPNVKCKLIALPSGNTLILNSFPLLEDKVVYFMAIQTLKYINPYSSDLSGRYYGNTKEISHRFKDTIATPLRSLILTEVGMISPSLQGLPVEMKLKILKLLESHKYFNFLIQLLLNTTQVDLLPYLRNR